VDRVTNEEVLQKYQKAGVFLDTVQQFKHKWIGHILRYESLLCELMSEDLGFMLWHSDSDIIAGDFCSFLCVGLPTVESE